MREAELLLQKITRTDQIMAEMRSNTNVILEQSRLAEDAAALQSDINIRARSLLLEIEDKLHQFNAIDTAGSL